jgi:hypothetical protein
MKTFKQEAEEFCQKHPIQANTTAQQTEDLPAFIAEKVKKAKETLAKVGLPKPELLGK